MPALRQAPVGKKKFRVTNEKQLATIFSRVFSPIFYEKIVTKALKYFSVTPDNIERVNQYVSEDKGQSFVTIFFKSKKVIPESENKIFQKEMRMLLKKTGYFGPAKSQKLAKMYGKSRHAVEVPLVWKAKTLGGCYCLFFERFS